MWLCYRGTEFFPQSDLWRQVDSRWALLQISSFYSMRVRWSVIVFKVMCLISTIDFSPQYQHMWLLWVTYLRNDLSCVEWNVILTHSVCRFRQRLLSTEVTAHQCCWYKICHAERDWLIARFCSLQPLNAWRVEHDKVRKNLKYTWSKQVNKMVRSVIRILVVAKVFLWFCS